MRKIILLVLILVINACSSDSSDMASNSSDGVGGSLARFILSGNYLYIVGDESLNIFEITDGENPVFKGSTYIGFDIETLYGLGDKLFVGSRLGMYIYDISSPENPLQLAEVNHVRSCDPVVSSGDFTYVTLHTNSACEGNINQLEIYNTENPLYPELLTTVQMNQPIGLGLYQNFLLVTDLDVVRVLDVSEPQYPNFVSSIPVKVFDVIIRGEELFVIGEESLTQFKISIAENEFNYLETSGIEF
ncbi:hypothetical protein [Mesonia aestuariivivens]|uniref:LVIVD repeat-containing protein n=1 Tax=Mesonia aestuariivivens TaxID=2796128 RepID=A0ABS6W2S6_9FLAO|nr:hypothetical protein [Mesonia aestuariivivens]MBW2961438.1 hypothetical protein [Mesonia aestuariivivens]